MRRVALGALGLVLALALGTTAGAGEILIGAGASASVYHQAGRAVCRMVNRHVKNVTCKAEPTAGASFNLSNVSGGALELGLAPSDLQYHAVKHSGPYAFTDISYANLRAVFSLQAEAFTVVARRDAGIRSLSDLKGKRVNIGNPGSTQRSTMEVVMKALGWSKGDFVLAAELPASQQSLAFCHNRVQAMVYMVAHPNAAVRQAATLCDGVIVEASGPEIDKLVAGTPYYSPVTILGAIYPNNPRALQTFGIRATVVTAADVPGDLVYALVAAVFDNLDEFRKLHPMFRELDPRRMVREGLSAPLHEGAVRYFKEKGLM